MVKILAISGSLRKISLNTITLNAIISLAPKVSDNSQIKLFAPEDLAIIPHFNPDLDIEGSIPAPVLKFRSELTEADGVIISSPEYAGGVAGTLKNSLDWMVSCSGLEFYGKPFALINISNRATKAYEDLKFIISTMGGNVVESASKHIPLPTNNINISHILKNPLFSAKLEEILKNLLQAIKANE